MIPSVYLGKENLLHRSKCIKIPFVFSDSNEKTCAEGKIQSVTSSLSRHAIPSTMTSPFHVIDSANLTEIPSLGAETSKAGREWVSSTFPC